jgi:hypothetical protein
VAQPARAAVRGGPPSIGEALGDRLVFLLEPLQTAIDLVEVAEHLASQIGKVVA